MSNYYYGNDEYVAFILLVVLFSLGLTTLICVYGPPELLIGIGYLKLAFAILSILMGFFDWRSESATLIFAFIWIAVGKAQMKQRGHDAKYDMVSRYESSMAF